METVYYVVTRMDGDYAILTNLANNQTISMARALLPFEIEEGTKLKYEMFEFEIM
ncbi:MAG: chorismate--pyruvate lyase [Firmicutes bacterium]|nr:chorismate--pyruvate lyase [Bacillota bacterium]